MNEVFLLPYGFKLISQLPTLYLLQPQQHYQSTNIYSTKHIKKTYLWTAAQLLLSSSKGYKNFAILCLCNDCLSSCSDDTVSIFNRRSCARCTCGFCFRTISNAIPRYSTLMCQWVGSLFPSLQDIVCNKIHRIFFCGNRFSLQKNPIMNSLHRHKNTIKTAQYHTWLTSELVAIKISKS